MLIPVIFLSALLAASITTTGTLDIPPKVATTSISGELFCGNKSPAEDTSVILLQESKDGKQKVRELANGETNEVGHFSLSIPTSKLPQPHVFLSIATKCGIVDFSLFGKKEKYRVITLKVPITTAKTPVDIGIWNLKATFHPERTLEGSLRDDFLAHPQAAPDYSLVTKFMFPDINVIGRLNCGEKPVSAEQAFVRLEITKSGGQETLSSETQPQADGEFQLTVKQLWPMEKNGAAFYILTECGIATEKKKHYRVIELTVVHDDVLLSKQHDIGEWNLRVTVQNERTIDVDAGEKDGNYILNAVVGLGTLLFFLG